MRARASAYSFAGGSLPTSKHRVKSNMGYSTEEFNATTLLCSTIGAMIAGVLVTLMLQHLISGPRARITNSSRTRVGPIEPLLLNGQLHAEDTSTSRSTAALNAVPLSKDLLMPVRPAWGNLVLCLMWTGGMMPRRLLGVGEGVDFNIFSLLL